MKTAKDRFHEVMDNLGLNDYKVHTSIEGISKNMMYKLRQGQTEEVSIKILMPFCEAFPQVNANYILTGKGSMFISETSTAKEADHESEELLLTYDELQRLYEATISRYERIIERMRQKFEVLERAFVDAKGAFERSETA